MKRIILLLLCISSLTIRAQEATVITANVNLSGNVAAFCESPRLDCDNPYLKPGFKWHLSNKVLLGQNFITFSISDKQGEECISTSWPEGCAIYMMIEGGIHCYAVQDKAFQHLMILERQDHSGYLVMLGSVPLR